MRARQMFVPNAKGSFAIFYAKITDVIAKESF